MWNEIWDWLYANYIFHTIVVFAIIFIIFFPSRLHKIFRIFRKVKAGPIELQAADDIAPDTPCPYKKSRDITFGQLRDVDSKVDKLTIEVREIMAIVKNMSIDQQKSSFYDEHQPDAERLAAGLKYVYLGGNGLTKPDVVAFVKKPENREVYNALVRINPELRLIID
jgi:hypothetical protein